LASLSELPYVICQSLFSGTKSYHKSGELYVLNKGITKRLLLLVMSLKTAILM